MYSECESPDDVVLNRTQLEKAYIKGEQQFDHMIQDEYSSILSESFAEDGENTIEYSSESDEVSVMAPTVNRKRRCDVPVKIVVDGDERTQVFYCPFEGCDFSNTEESIVKFHTKCHMMEDTGSKASFTSTKKNRKRHISGEKLYQCSYPGCNSSFTQADNLKVHMRIHTGEKPYKCSYPGCNSAFTQAGNLKVHMRIHTGEKPYKCSYPGCNSAFTQAGNLKVHMRIHTGEKPYKCSYPGCNSAFIHTGNLKVHIRRHHAHCFVCW